MLKEIPLPAGLETAESERTKGLPSFTAMTLGIGLLGFGVFSLLTTFLLVYRYGTPITYSDQWVIVFELMKSKGHPTWAQIWAAAAGGVPDDPGLFRLLFVYADSN